MRSSSDEPENAVDETASVGTREFCQDLETPSLVLSSAELAPCTREIPANPGRAIETRSPVLGSTVQTHCNPENPTNPERPSRRRALS